MGVLVIVGYRAKPGQEQALLSAIKDHVPVLRSQGLVTERPPYIMRARDGTFVEVFEWKSQAAIDAAHTHPAVMKLWDRFSACCEYVPIADVAEAQELFSPFEPLAL
ncbi:MAG: hypothetical protein ABW321_30540 [Polyangiales bacterium]